MKKLTPLALFLFAGCVGQLSAQSNNCLTAALSVYDQSGFSCHLNGSNGGTLIFDSFFFSAINTTYTDSQIRVTPLAQGEGGGFSFSLFPSQQGQDPPPFTVGAGLTDEFGIDYDWHFFVDPFSDAASLGLDPGNVTVTENICVDPFIIQGDFTNVQHGCSSTYQFSVDESNPPDSENKTISINPAAQSGEDISLDFLMTGGDSGAAFDSLSATYDVVDTIAPEPVTSVLGLGGLLAIALRRRYRNA